MNDDFRDMMPTSEEFYAPYAPPTNGNGLTPSEQAEHEREYNAYLDQQQE